MLDRSVQDARSELVTKLPGDYWCVYRVCDAPAKWGFVFEYGFLHESAPEKKFSGE